MNSKLLEHRTPIIVIAAILIAAIGFGAGMMVRTSRAAEDPSNYIGADRAKQIALENVGVSKPKATFTKVEIDASGNEQEPCYSLVFHTASTEYHMQIHALDGSISHKESQDLIPLEDRLSAQIQETAVPGAPRQNAIRSIHNRNSSVRIIISASPAHRKSLYNMQIFHLTLLISQVHIWILTMELFSMKLNLFPMEQNMNMKLMLKPVQLFPLNPKV